MLKCRHKLPKRSCNLDVVQSINTHTIDTVPTTGVHLVTLWFFRCIHSLSNPWEFNKNCQVTVEGAAGDN